MAINSQKFLPSSKGGALSKINKTTIKGSSSVLLSNSSVKNIGIIKVKVIEIDSILKGTLASEKKKLNEVKKQESSKRREKIEEKLETKPKAESGKIKMPSLPRMGFLDWVKNFIGNVILGYFAVRLVDHLPKIIPIVKFLGQATDFVLGVGGKLLDGLVTFIDWGYKAYDATRGFVKNLFGEGGVKQFDQLSGLLNQFLNLAIIAGMATAGTGGFGGGRGGTRPRPGTGGRPKVTTSGGGRAGGIDIRNPLRGRPQVTMGRGGAKTVLSSVRPFLKRIPLPVVGALIDFGLSWALGENPGRAAFRAIGAAILGTIGGGLAGALGLAGGPLAVATGALGAIAGGTLGDMAGGALYDLFFGGKKPSGKSGKYAGGGPTRGGRPQRGVRRSISKKRRYKRKLTIQKPGKVEATSPGSDVGGEDKLFGLFPNPLKFLQKASDTMNPFKVIQKAGQNLGDSDYFGPILSITSKILLGQKPSQQDYKNVGLGINMLVAKGIDDGKLKGGLAAFAEGGFVDPKTLDAIAQGSDISDWVSKSFKDATETNAQKTLREIQENLRLKKDKQEEEPKEGPGMDGGGGGGGASEGGITGSGVNKAISVSKKLIADLGITPAQAAGIVGNFLYESAGMNPGEREGSPYGTPEKPPALGTVDVGYGWAQWTNSRPGDRLDKFLKSYGGDKGKIASDNDNYRFLMTELRGSETLNRKGVVTGTLFPKDDPIAASDWFRRNWERAGVPADEKRRKETLAVFEKIKGLSRDQAKADVAAAGGAIGEIGDGRLLGANPRAKEILKGAKKIIGMGAGSSNQCANTTRAALRAAGHPAANKVTKRGDLDTPKGTAYNAPSFAASFGGSDMGQIIRNKSNIKAGDIILWRQTSAGGSFNKGAITHVGIAADDGLKNQYDHNSSRGWHYRPHWDSAAGTSWFAGVRLMDAGGMVNGLTPAILGERGKPEGVIGSKVTEYLEEMAPGTLPAIIGSKSKDQLANALRSFNNYGFGPPDEIFVDPNNILSQINDQSDNPSSYSSGFFMSSSEEESDPFSTLYQGG